MLYNIFLQIWNMDTIELVEQFKVILLTRANKVLGFAEISSGGITCVAIDISLVFAVAKATAPARCFYLQNHMDAIFYWHHPFDFHW